MKLSECEICSRLDDVNYASSKYGSDESTSLPASSARLANAQEDPGGDRRSFVKKCPNCGVFYLYETDYEYLAGGSEDSETLTRLTATEARNLMAPELLESLIEGLRGDLEAPQPMDRRYAGMSLAGYAIDNQDLNGLSEILGNRDEEVVRGALTGLLRWSSRDVNLDYISGVQPAIEAVASSGMSGLHGLAGAMLAKIRIRNLSKAR